jgi:hypothetical protein
MSEADPTSALDPTAAATEMIEELKRSNPQLAMLAQLMQARAIVPQEISDDLSDEVAALANRLAQAEAKIERMKQQGRRLYDAHQSVTARLADLAAALGACGLCWGEDDSCPSCRGRGRPGMVRPDLELRARLLGSSRQPVAHAEPPTTH